MFENIIKFFRKLTKSQEQGMQSKDRAKERLHLVLMQDRANVSADFLELMKQEIIEVIKKYIEVEEDSIDVRLTNKVKEDGTIDSPYLYANIPILNIKNDMAKNKNVEDKKIDKKENKEDNKEKEKEEEEIIEEIKEEIIENNKEEKNKKQDKIDDNKQEKTEKIVEENVEDKEKQKQEKENEKITQEVKEEKKEDKERNKKQSKKDNTSSKK